MKIDQLTAGYCHTGLGKSSVPKDASSLSSIHTPRCPNKDLLLAPKHEAKESVDSFARNAFGDQYVIEIQDERLIAFLESMARKIFRLIQPLETRRLIAREARHYFGHVSKRWRAVHK